MNITCRPVDFEDSGDCEVFLKLLQEYATDPMGGGEALPESSVHNLVEEMKKREILNAYLAFVDGIPAGVTTTIDSFSTFACKPLLNVHDFAVTEPFRRKGVAKALLSFVIERARENGMCKVTLEVLQGNTPAKGCYAGLGFEPYVLDEANGVAEFWSKKLK
jgi:GNAT superfamily N-acetyltransferase